MMILSDLFQVKVGYVNQEHIVRKALSYRLIARPEATKMNLEKSTVKIVRKAITVTEIHRTTLETIVQRVITVL